MYIFLCSDELNQGSILNRRYLGYLRQTRMIWKLRTRMWPAEPIRNWRTTVTASRQIQNGAKPFSSVKRRKKKHGVKITMHTVISFVKLYLMACCLFDQPKIKKSCHSHFMHIFTNFNDILKNFNELPWDMYATQWEIEMKGLIIWYGIRCIVRY